MDNSNTTLVKVKWIKLWNSKGLLSIQIQHLLKLNDHTKSATLTTTTIQIQHLLKLNIIRIIQTHQLLFNSNTTLVKVKFSKDTVSKFVIGNSNTTLVKVKFISKFTFITRILLFKYNTC